MRDSEIAIPVKFDIDKADLERQLRELDSESIKIPVNFDVENVQDDINRATRGARAGAVTVPVEVDRDALDESLADIGKNVDAVEIQADLDEDRLQAEIARVQGLLDSLDGRRVIPHVELLQSSFEAQLRELNAELDRLRAQRVEVPVEVDVDAGALFNLKATLAELQRDPVQIDFDFQEAELLRNIAAIEAELNKLDGKEVTPEIGANIAEALAKLAAYQAALNALDGKRIEAIADLDVDTLRADARIQAFLARMRVRRGITLPVNVAINQNSLAAQLNNLAKRFPGLGQLGQNFAAVFASIGSVIGGVANNLGTITRGLITAGLAAVQLASMLAVAGTVAIGLAAAGATVTAAWGAASSAISTLPAVMALIGVPAAAVMLGLDGIKKAAAGIAPEFDKLKASVSEVFERGLTPVLNNLAKATFPALQTGLKGTAAVLVEMARELGNVVIKATEVGQLKTIFDNVNNAIRLMTPGITDITKAFLLLGEQKGAFDVLTTAVNTFGAAFRQGVIDTINDGSLTAAFTGLKGLLSEVAQGFADLVRNGIQLFAAAAPGVNSFLNDLTGFFNRFDWNALGTAVGGVFRGLGETLRNVPQGTITNIQVAFQKLADTFQSKAFQAGLGELIDLIPRAIDLIRILADGFARTALAISGSVDVIVGGFKSIALALEALFGNDPLLLFSDQFKTALDAANQQVADGLGKIEQSYATFDPQLPPSTVGDQLGGALDTVVATAETKLAALKTALAKGMTEAQSTMVGGWEATGVSVQAAATSALAPVAATASVQGVGVFEAWDREMDKLNPATRSKMQVLGQSVGGELAKVPPAAGAALAPLPGEVSGALGQVPAAAEGALAPLQQLQALQAMKTSFGVAFMELVGTTTLGMQSISATVASGMPGIVAAFNFQNIGLQIGLAFQGLVGTATLGMASLAATVASGMPAIQAAFNFTNVGLQVGQVFLGLVGTFNLGMASLAATVTAGMPLIAAAFNFTTISQGVGLAFLGLVGTVNLGMLSVVAAVTTGMTQVAAAFNFQLIGASVGLSFLNLVGTVTLGMAGLVVAVQTGMASIALAFNFAPVQAAVGQAFLGMVGTVTLGMAGLAAAVTTGMSMIAAAFNFAPVQASVGVAFLGLIGTIRLGMAGLAAEATAGMNGVVVAITAGMQRAVAAVTAAGAQISSAGQVSMAGFGAAIQVGMNTAVATVVAGAARITTSVTTLGTTITTSITTAMNAFRVAVSSGMTAAQTAVTSGVTGMISRLRGAVGQFQAIGMQMMQGLRAGILSQAGSIAAAAAQVVSRAVAAARAAAVVRSPSRVFMQIGTYMGEGLALGMEKSGPRVERAADTMISSVAGIADQMTSTFSDAKWASDFGAKVENSLGDTVVEASDKDVVGQLRALNGNVDQSPYFATLIAEVRALRQAVQTSSATGVAATARTAAALGAF